MGNFFFFYSLEWNDGPLYVGTPNWAEEGSRAHMTLNWIKQVNDSAQGFSFAQPANNVATLFLALPTISDSSVPVQTALISHTLEIEGVFLTVDLGKNGISSGLAGGVED